MTKRQTAMSTKAESAKTVDLSRVPGLRSALDALIESYNFV